MINLQCAVDDADSHIACVKEMIADYLVIIEMLGRTGQHMAIAEETLESRSDRCEPSNPGSVRSATGSNGNPPIPCTDNVGDALGVKRLAQSGGRNSGRGKWRLQRLELLKPVDAIKRNKTDSRAGHK